MTHLFEKLRNGAKSWREEGYPCPDYPLIGEILRWQFEGDINEGITLKYLRKPQFQSLELYWFLRLKRDTPHIIDLYKHYYGDNVDEFCKAMGIPITPGQRTIIKTVDEVIDLVKNNQDFVKQLQIDPLYEAVTLAYPSYIFALTMGTGKTHLIGTIIATEFAMALRHPGEVFMKNALVFAPGTTIIKSLRKISEIPYDLILPPGVDREFLANLKITYPPDGTPNIPVQQNSTYNIIVTNTEKISLRADAKRRSNQTELDFDKKNEQIQLVANLRLQTITSLSCLGIFSDEAHHTYGNKIDKDLKRVRDTVNYINEKTNLIAVINTTGTPYAKRQMLREVVTWYSLGEGIRDNILKSLLQGVVDYPVGTLPDRTLFGNIIDDFFDKYGDVHLSDGAKAKIAFYFKTQTHLEISRDHIENALLARGESIDLILQNTQLSSKEEVAEFDSLNDTKSNKRVILLIGKGVEGWDCPSLFACALIKEQSRSSNFILQAATRCLRQKEGNLHPARIFIDTANRGILDKELKENFGTTLTELRTLDSETEDVQIRICKPVLPKLKITRFIHHVVPIQNGSTNIELQVPSDVENAPSVFRSILTPNFMQKEGAPLTGLGEQEEIYIENRKIGCYMIAKRLSTNYHLPFIEILNKLKRLYPEGEIPDKHFDVLCKQVESQQKNYKIEKEKVTEVLALIRLHDKEGNLLFERDDENGYYFHTVRLRKNRVNLLRQKEDLDETHNVSFHYTPYDFDSSP